MRLHHLLLVVAACGGGSSKPKPDAFVQKDAPGPDANICATVSMGTASAQQRDPFVFLNWGGNVTGNAPDGNTLTFVDSFQESFQGAPSSLMGAFPLDQGVQTNVSSCALCFLAFSTQTDAQGNPLHTYFQSAGSATLTEDPFTHWRLMGSVTGLKMVEVTIGQTGSTPVPNGECLNFSDFTVNANSVPAAWTCTPDKFVDGTNCDCMCGAQDPDCDNHALTETCATGNACFAGSCVATPANDTCTTAIPLTLGTAVNGTTAGAGSDYNVGLEGTGCTGFTQPGYDVAYSVVLTSGTAYTFTLNGLPATFDASISLVGPGAATVCSATITTCVAGSDQGFEGDPETFTYTPTATGTYFVIVDSFYKEEGGAFTLLVQ